MIWFLHVRKCAGTAVRKALAGHPSFTLCDHDVTLAHVPEPDLVLLALRDPVDRLVSGYYDRLREGGPAYRCLWSDADRAVFARYPSVLSLADDLGAGPEARAAATQALQTLTHTSARYWDWLRSRELVAIRRARFLYVMFSSGTERGIEADFEHALALAGLPPVALPTDRVGAHRAPQAHRPVLSVRQRAALRGYCYPDYDAMHALIRLVDHGRLSPALLRWWREERER